MDAEPTIKLELTVREVNVVLAGLGTLPHNQVALLFDKIRMSAIEQTTLKTPESPA